MEQLLWIGNELKHARQSKAHLHLDSLLAFPHLNMNHLGDVVAAGRGSAGCKHKKPGEKKRTKRSASTDKDGATTQPHPLLILLLLPNSKLQNVLFYFWPFYFRTAWHMHIIHPPSPSPQVVTVPSTALTHTRLNVTVAKQPPL